MSVPLSFSLPKRLRPDSWSHSLASWGPSLILGTDRLRPLFTANQRQSFYKIDI